MSRNQKATTLASAFYVLGFALFIWGWMLQPETRVSGTIGKKHINIPVYLQNEPEYQGLKNSKVLGGWGGGRLLLWIAGAACEITGVVLSCERQGELEKEQILYEIECKEIDQQGQLDAAYRLSLNKKMKERTGETALALHEDSLVSEADAMRELNGWEAPIKPEPPRQIAPPQLKNEAIAPPANSDEIDFQTLAAIARKRLANDKNEDDRPDSDRPSNTDGKVGSDARYQLYSDRGTAIMDSMIRLKMSILNVAPTGCGKTHTMDKWLKGIMKEFPGGDYLVIAQKNDPFMGLSDRGFVKLFDPFKPEIALQYLDKVYAKMQERLQTPKRDRAKFDDYPIRLILDDWYATYQVLKLDAALWKIVSIKLSSIITLGREVNVCLYIATQSYILAALGLAEDSNIRDNLAIICQGFVRIIDEKKQGSFGTIKGIIKNDYIVPGKEDKERLAREIQELVKLSNIYQRPVWFSAIGEPTLALAPHIDIELDDPWASNTNVAIIDSNSEDTNDDVKQFTDAEARRWAMEFDLKSSNSESQSQSEQPENDAQNNDSISDSATEQAESQSEQPESEQILDPELVGWYRWLPTKLEVVKLLEETDGNLYNFSSFVRSKLKKTETNYNKKTKNAIVELLLTLERFDLITKYEIDTKKYPI